MFSHKATAAGWASDFRAANPILLMGESQVGKTSEMICQRFRRLNLNQSTFVLAAVRTPTASCGALVM